MICTTATFLNRFFNSCGKVFRIGGDEFAVFVYDMEEEKLLGLIDRMDSEIGEYNMTSEIKIYFALGYDHLNADDNSVEQCIRRADKKMYDEKNRSKTI